MGYDQTLFEDRSANRMQESMALFKQMLSNPFFRNTPFILFLNKEDIFNEKIATSSITSAFPDYTGSQNPDEAKNYIKKRYTQQNENPKRKIYPFFTNATDTELVQHVFASVKKIILDKVIDEYGMA